MTGIGALFTRALAAAVVVLALTAGSLLAHSQTVTPPGVGDPVVTGPISNAWAQAHCNAAAPTIIADRSDGVVQFLPAAALPCPPVANPGGQVHGD
jgi:hypothetical protein